MTALAHDLIGVALRTLGDALDPWLTEQLRPALPPGSDWTDLLRLRDRTNGQEKQSYSSHDPSLALRMLTERVLPRGQVESWDRLDHQVRAHASELREFRNRWAHHAELTDDDGDRALDTAERLLTRLHLDEAAQRCRAARRREQPLAPEPPPETPAGGRRAAPDEPVSPAASGALIELETLSHLSLAMTLAQVRPVRQVRVHSVTANVSGCQLELGVEGLHGPVADTHAVRLDLVAGSENVLQQLDLLLDARALAGITSAEPATVTARLTDGSGGLLAEASGKVVLEPPQFWRAVPLELGTEMLAAYVQPHSPAISETLHNASTLVAQRTGTSKLDGYQSDDPARIDAAVEAVWDAVRGRDIAYSEPPASWGEVGQLIRTPHQVLQERLGTCMDTAVTLAAALKQAGINSTLWLLPGHIFLAYWRTDSWSEAAASTDVATYRNLVELGQLVPLETTLLCGGPTSQPLGVAAETARRTAADGDVVIVGDVRAARHAGIRPLRSQSEGQQDDVPGGTQGWRPGWQQPQPGPSPEPASRPDRPRERGAPAPEQPRRVQDWKNALLDLSLRNRLINYTDRAGLALAVPGRSLPELEDLLHDGHAIGLQPSDDLPQILLERGTTHGAMLSEADRAGLLRERKRIYVDVPGGRYLTQLRSLANKARTIVSETGANNLYLASGMLRWTLDDRELRSPLILTPVTLTTASRGSAYRIELDPTGTSTPNYCLLEKLRTSLQLELPGLQEPETDEAGIDVGAALQSVREALVASGQPFSVEATAELAILQFARFALWRDLDEHWSSFAGNSLVRHLIETPHQDSPTRRPQVTARLGRAEGRGSGTRRRLPARRGRWAHLHARGPARHRQVAEHHQPARPRRGPRQEDERLAGLPDRPKLRTLEVVAKR